MVDSKRILKRKIVDDVLLVFETSKKLVKKLVLIVVNHVVLLSWMIIALPGSDRRMLQPVQCWILKLVVF